MVIFSAFVYGSEVFHIKKKIRIEKYSVGGGGRKRNERSRYKDDLPLLLYYEGEKHEIFLFQEKKK